ncbi:periplasmic beta-glucosidase [Aquipluma nitroreducens]|uniref:Periplasmic beta-glucosidase n=1 Tax=Aquipluma nitroreducens TaxID=2010828 RepID=A0A5K7SFD6_9BACT|nr:beta-glucosidase BglX [Aquipluma nitroreducens]BBE20352.1 periplasmic beta-glucosidase [Aquipluma nitroreducens]
MKKLQFLLVSLFAVCSVFGQNAKMDAFINQLMGKMTLEEKLGQLNLSSGSVGAILAGGGGMIDEVRKGQIGATGAYSFKTAKDIETASQESRLKIPVLIGVDVIHGYKTGFPIPLGLASTWDLDMIEKSARIAAVEASANGICWTYSPMLDIARDPRWGRVAEGAGEDAWWGSQIAKAMIHGYQGEDLSKDNTIMACVKHFALYGAAEAGRDYNTVDMSRLTMYQYYLPPYKAAFDAGAGSAMSSFNLIDGIPATGNKWLLTDLLRKEWGFKGFVVTDYTSINEMMAHGMGDLQAVDVLALKAGVDMDMQGLGFLTTLKKSLDEGKVTMKDIDTACRRVLEAKYKRGLFDDPYKYVKEERLKSEVLTPEHLKFARELGARSMVLLKNNNQTLPLKKSGKIAVVGPLADSKADLLGAWSTGDVTKTTSVIDGIKGAVQSGAEVVFAKGANITDDPYLKEGIKNPFAAYMGIKEEIESRTPSELLAEAVDVAKNADVVVAVLGESASMSGEAASRSDISIPESQENLLKALVATGKPVVLVLVNGRPLILNWENENVPAILEAWAPGIEGGNAIADVLFGDYNPSGKITMTFPRSVGQIPIYYNHKNTGRPMDPKNKFTSKYLDIPNEPLYPFGYGLSYTTFEYGDVVLSKTNLKDNETLSAKIKVTNTGKVAGEEVVQLYISDPVASISRSVKDLKGFQKIGLNPGETKEIEFKITTEELKFFNSDLKYDWESGEFVVQIGTNSQDVKQAKCEWIK